MGPPVAVLRSVLVLAAVALFERRVVALGAQRCTAASVHSLASCSSRRKCSQPSCSSRGGVFPAGSSNLLSAFVCINFDAIFACGSRGRCTHGVWNTSDAANATSGGESASSQRWDKNRDGTRLVNCILLNKDDFLSRDETVSAVSSSGPAGRYAALGRLRERLPPPLASGIASSAWEGRRRRHRRTRRRFPTDSPADSPP